VTDLQWRWKVLIVLVLLATVGAPNLEAAPPGQLTANPLSFNFGPVMVGSSLAMAGTFTNTGGTNLTISQVSVSGSYFQLSGLSAPLTLAPNQSASFSVTFTPQTGGSFSGSMSVTFSAQKKNPRGTNSQTISLSLSGTGTIPGQLTATPASIDFTNVQVGNSQTLSETLTNSGSSDVTITQAAITGAAFSLSGLTLPVTLPAGQSTAFSATFSPQAGGAVTGNIAIMSNAPNSTLNIALSGTGVTAGLLAANPSSLSFGNVQIGNSQTLSETLTNSGGSDVTITQATITGAGFSLSGLTLPVTLAAGQSKAFSVAFAPQSGGAVTGNLAVISNASNSTLNIALSGTGVTAGLLAANPSSLSFGSVQVGQSLTLSETLTNSGGSDVTITQATVTGAGFSISGLTLPVTLAAGQSKTFSVAFAPQVGGAVTGSLAVISNGSNPTLNIALSGLGVTAGLLAANPTSLNFGNVQIGNNQTLSETLTNSGGSDVTITQATVTGTGFSLSGLTLPVTLAAGQSKAFSVAFAPQVGGAVTGNLAVISNASNSTLNIALSGTGATAGFLSANPSSLSFGSVQVGSSKTLSEVLTNSGGSTVTVSQATVTGTGFSLSGLTLPLTLNPGQSFTFSAIFAPAVAGSVSGSISVISNGSNPTLTIALSGTGTAAGMLTVTPATLDFGSVVVGSSKNLTGALSASGSSVTVSSVAVSTSEFSVSGVSFPFTIAAGQSTSFTVTFKPQASGTASASASFVSNASNSPTIEALTGTGTQAPQHSVDLSWSASISQVAGYNVYRGSNSGGPYSKINSALDVTIAYTDSSVQAGLTYFYVTTAVDTNGMESKYSNEVQAVVPTP
jgi:hypothetical protein